MFRWIKCLVLLFACLAQVGCATTSIVDITNGRSLQDKLAAGDEAIVYLKSGIKLQLTIRSVSPQSLSGVSEGRAVEVRYADIDKIKKVNRETSRAWKGVWIVLGVCTIVVIVFLINAIADMGRKASS